MGFEKSRLIAYERITSGMRTVKTISCKGFNESKYLFGKVLIYSLRHTTVDKLLFLFG